jgi:hypothetical protein
MKRQKSCGPRLGKLVHQLPGVVTFAYYLRFRRVIARWKGIAEEIHFGGSIMPLTIIEPRYQKTFICDPGGYWWPPTYSTWTPTIASFSFSVFAQFTIFSSFFGS